MRALSLKDWLQDVREPIPELWNTRDFYRAALSMGLTDKETILYTLAVMERAEEISQASILTYDEAVKTVLIAIDDVVDWRTGLAVESRMNAMIWNWRVRVWIWRFKKCVVMVERYRLQIGSFLHLIKR